MIDAARLGAIRRLPDPPLPRFDSNAVVASRAAYGMGAPDATIGSRQLSSLLLLCGALGAIAYLWDMLAREKKRCAYCLPAAACNPAMVPLAWPLARAAWRAPRGRG